jgi:hypothetical protein
MFKMAVDEQVKYRIFHRSKLLAAARAARDELITQLIQTKTCQAPPAFLEAVQIPVVDRTGDTLAQQVCALVLSDTDKIIITFRSSTTRQLRVYLSSSPAPDPEPPPALPVAGPETRAKTRWRKFWNAKIPYRARSI